MTSELHIEEQIEKLEKKVTEDLFLNDKNLVEETKNNLAKHHRYLTMLRKEKFTLAALYRERDRIYAQIHDHIRFGKGVKKDIRLSEIPTYINKTSKYQEINKKVREQKIFVDYLSEVCDLFKSRGYSIKNLIDLLKDQVL